MKERAPKILGVTTGLVVFAAGCADAVAPPQPTQPAPERRTPTSVSTRAATPETQEIAKCIERGERHISTISFTRREQQVSGYYEASLEPNTLSERQSRYSLQTGNSNCPTLGLVFTRNPDGSINVLGKIEAGGGKIEWISKFSPGRFEQDQRFIFGTDDQWNNIYPLGPTETTVQPGEVKPRFPETAATPRASIPTAAPIPSRGR